MEWMTQRSTSQENENLRDESTYSTGDKRRYQKNKELESGALSEYQGVVKYHPLFAQ
jgi:hypothetical protein